MSWLKRFIIFTTIFMVLGLFDTSLVAWAAGAIQPGASLGQISENTLGPVSAMTTFVHNICYVLGGCFLLGTVVQYKAHRDNPSQVKISQPIVLLIISLVLLALPFLTSFSAGAAAATGTG